MIYKLILKYGALFLFTSYSTYTNAASRTPVIEYALDKVPPAPGVFLNPNRRQNTKRLNDKHVSKNESPSVQKPITIAQDIKQNDPSSSNPNIGSNNNNPFNKRNKNIPTFNHPVLARIRNNPIIFRKRMKDRPMLRRRNGAPIKFRPRKKINANMGKSGTDRKNLFANGKPNLQPVPSVLRKPLIKLPITNGHLPYKDIVNLNVKKTSTFSQTNDDFIHHLTSEHYKTKDKMSLQEKFLNSAMRGISNDYGKKIFNQNNSTLLVARGEKQSPKEKISNYEDTQIFNSIVSIVNNSIQTTTVKPLTNEFSKAGILFQTTMSDSNIDLSHLKTSKPPFRPSLLLSVTKEESKPQINTDYISTVPLIDQEYKTSSRTSNPLILYTTTQYPTAAWKPEPDTSRYRPKPSDLYSNHYMKKDENNLEIKVGSNIHYTTAVQPPIEYTKHIEERPSYVIFPDEDNFLDEDTFDNLLSSTADKLSVSSYKPENILPKIQSLTNDVWENIPNWVFTSVDRNHGSKPKENVGSSSGELAAVTGLAIVGSFLTYVLMSGGGLAIGRHRPDPLVMVVRGARHGLEVLVNGLDEFEDYLGVNTKEYKEKSSEVESRTAESGLDGSVINAYTNMIEKQNKEIGNIFQDFLKKINQFIGSASFVKASNRIQTNTSITHEELDTSNSSQSYKEITSRPNSISNSINKPETLQLLKSDNDLLLSMIQIGEINNTRYEEAVHDDGYEPATVTYSSVISDTTDQVFNDRSFHNNRFISDFYSDNRNFSDTTKSETTPMLPDVTDVEISEPTTVNFKANDYLRNYYSMIASRVSGMNNVKTPKSMKDENFENNFKDDKEEEMKNENTEESNLNLRTMIINNKEQIFTKLNSDRSDRLSREQMVDGNTAGLARTRTVIINNEVHVPV